jgi:hypothetical protein
MRNLSITATALTLCAALFAGCSGGGSHSSLPAVNAPVGTSSANSKVSLTVRRLTTTPAQVLQANKRTAKSISTVAAALKIEALTATGGSAATPVIQSLTDPTFLTSSCVQSTIYTDCTVPANVPSTSTGIRVSVCPDAACAQPALDTAGIVVLTSANFTPGTANNAITVTLTGVPVAIKVFAQNLTPTINPVAGSPPILLVVQVYDADGAAILGPDAYTQPVIVDATAAAPNWTLSVVSAQNLDQFANGTPAPAITPQANQATVTLANRYVQAQLNFAGGSTAPFTLTATMNNLPQGSITSSLTITPTTSSTFSAFNGTQVAFPITNPATAVSVSQDTTATIWARFSAGAAPGVSVLQQLSPSTLQPTGAQFPVSPAGTAVEGLWVNGPDGQMWSTYCVRSGNACSAAGFVQFNISGHVYAYFPLPAPVAPATNPIVFQAVNTGTSLIASDSGSEIIVLPFTGSFPSSSPGSTSSVAWAPPPATASAALPLVPAPQSIAQTGDGKLWVIENNATGGAQTYIAQVNAAGVKQPATESQMSPGSSLLQYIAYAANPTSGSTIIAMSDNALTGQVYTYDTATKVITAIASVSNLGTFPAQNFAIATYDSIGGLWFVSANAHGSGRTMNHIDPTRGRIDNLGINLPLAADDVTFVGGKIVVAGAIANSGSSSGHVGALYTFTPQSPN